MSNSHTHSDAELEVGLLQASITEVSDEVVTISVDQPHPPANNEEPLTCNEPHPSACSNHSPPSIEESVSNQQPLPLHEPNDKAHSQTTSNLEPHPTAKNDNENTVNEDQPRLLPSNQLLFELD